jgi:hypothetical protein
MQRLVRTRAAHIDQNQAFKLRDADEGPDGIQVQRMFDHFATLSL